jgi:hypothetical protein
MASSAAKSYPSTAFVLSLIGGIFILLAGIATAILYAFVGGILSVLPGLGGLGALFIALAVVAVLFGLIIIFGAFMMRAKPSSSKMWGAIILVLALLSWVGGGGFVIGFILALIGGILALVWHPPPAPQAAWGQPAAPVAPAAPGGPGWGSPPPPASPPPS